MIPVRISSCAKSVLKYKYLILDTYHPDTLYLRKQGLEDPWLFFEAKRGPRTKQFEKHRLYESEAGHRERPSRGRNVRSILHSVRSYDDTGRGTYVLLVYL